MLSARPVMSREGVGLADVACRHAAGRGDTGEPTPGFAVVFVRRGCFVRSVEGVESLFDPTLAYCMNPGEEQRYDHPHGDGDDCTTLFLSPRVVASLCGGEARLPPGPLPVSPEVDLEHRLLLAAARQSHDSHELLERAIAIIARVLEQVDSRRIDSGRPAAVRARRALADGVREALAESPDCSLTELAGAFSVSPHHLSRVFHSATGHTVSRHRMRLRARIALERLADGERNLGRLAADTGFTDQSHLSRVLTEETGRTPAALRRALAH